MNSKLIIRQALEHIFKSKLDRNVSLLAADYCKSEDLPEAAALYQTSNETISNHLWSTFTFDWQNVQENPGGTSGRMGRFVAAKLEYTVAWAVAKGVQTNEILQAEKTVLESLHLLWLEWAGYMATTSEDYMLAIRD
jgi:hypothetical protein